MKSNIDREPRNGNQFDDPQDSVRLVAAKTRSERVMILQLQEYEDQRIRNTKRRRVSRLLPNIVSRMRGAGMLAFVPYSRRGRQLTRWDFENPHYRAPLGNRPMFAAGNSRFTGPMLNPDLQHVQYSPTAGTVAAELVSSQNDNSDTVRYLSDLWNNLCELQELMAQDMGK